MIKKIVVVLVLLLVVAAGALYFLAANIDTLVTRAVNTLGPKILKTSVHLGRTEISPSTGKGSLYHLEVGNPPGFQAGNAIQLEEISVTLDTGTITQDPVVVKEILIDAPQIAFQMSANKKSNVQVLQKNVDDYSAQFEKKESSKGRKMVIEHLYIKNGKVRISADLLKGKDMTVSLGKIHLRDLGKAEGGATPAEVVQKVIAAIQKNVSLAVTPLNLDQMKEKVAEGAKQMLGENLQSALEQNKEGLKDPLKNLEQDTGNLDGALGGLLGK